MTVHEAIIQYQGSALVTVIRKADGVHVYDTASGDEIKDLAGYYLLIQVC